MLADVATLLRCPRCHTGVRADATVLRCQRGHQFDVGRQGYVNLLGTAPPATADTAAMVQARAQFLASGHYLPLAQAVCVAVGPGEGPVVEIGAGTAYYLAAVLHARPRSVGVAIDVSVPASRRAARAHRRIGAVVADAWGSLPLMDQCADAVLVVFAPRGGAEIARVLRPGGRLVVLTPAADHLGELVEPLGLIGVDPRKDERLRAALDPWFVVREAVSVRFGMALDVADVEHLAAMGPSAFHTSPAERQRRVAALALPASVTAAATLTTFCPRP